MTQAVLAGGLLCDQRLWGDVQPKLAGVSHAVTFDRESTLEGMARSILAVPLSRFKLVGFSMGGMAALLAAAMAPERITSLLLIGTHAEPETAERQANRARQIAAVERDGLQHFVETELLPMYFASESARTSYAKLVAGMAQACGAVRFRRHVQALSRRPDPRPLLHLLTMPVIVVSGAEDRVARPEWGQALAARLPAAAFHALPHIGHMIPLECPAELANIVEGAA